MTSHAPRVSLVTGGAGFIGSHLIERLLDRGDRIVVVDDFSTGRRDNLAHLDGSRIELIEGTVGDTISALAGRKFHEIYHLAASVGVFKVVEQPIETIRNNVLETSALLEFAALTRTPMLLASTSEVYGKSTQTPFKEHDDVVYGATIFSRWSYGCSKAIDEFLALAFHREKQLPVVIARLFNTVGPRQVGTYGMVLPRMVAAALQGKPIEVFGDGQQTRCFCDGRDTVRALMALVGEPKCAGEVFNVGRDESISIAGLAELVRDTLESDSKIVFVPYDEAYGQGFDDLRHRQPDLSRLRAAIEFKPSIPLVKTIRDLAEALSTKPVASRGASS